jgi:hypothetical protein
MNSVFSDQPAVTREAAREMPGDAKKCRKIYYIPYDIPENPPVRVLTDLPNSWPNKRWLPRQEHCLASMLELDSGP